MTVSIILTPTVAIAQGVEDLKDTKSDQLFAESVHILGGIRNPVLRWYGTVKLAVVGESDEMQITPIMNEISLLTGINYRRVYHEFDKAESYLAAVVESPSYDLSLCDRNDQTVCANFIVLVTNQKTMYKIAKSLPLRPVFQKASRGEQKISCFFSPGISRQLEIKQNIVYVNEDLEIPMLPTCLQEEIYQSFGLFGDYTDSQYFSFNNNVVVKNITVFDKALLTSLYDHAFLPGTPAAPIAKQMRDYCELIC